MWALVNTDNGSVIDIVTDDVDKYISIYEDLSVIIWIEWPAAVDDFNKENITEWCYDSTKTPSFIKKIDVTTPDINNSLEMNIITAKLLIAKTDWAVLPDVNIRNKLEFIDYRSTIRDYIINPRAGIITWPDLIEPRWSVPI